MGGVSKIIFNIENGTSVYKMKIYVQLNGSLKKCPMGAIPVFLEVQSLVDPEESWQCLTVIRTTLVLPRNTTRPWNAVATLHPDTSLTQVSYKGAGVWGFGN